MAFKSRGWGGHPLLICPCPNSSFRISREKRKLLSVASLVHRTPNLVLKRQTEKTLWLRPDLLQEELAVQNQPLFADPWPLLGSLDPMTHWTHLLHPLWWVAAARCWTCWPISWLWQGAFEVLLALCWPHQWTLQLTKAWMLTLPQCWHGYERPLVSHYYSSLPMSCLSVSLS